MFTNWWKNRMGLIFKNCARSLIPTCELNNEEKGYVVYKNAAIYKRYLSGKAQKIHTSRAMSSGQVEEMNLYNYEQQHNVPPTMKYYY